MQAAYLEATRTPLETMEHCLAVMRHTLAVVAKGNPNAASDAVVGLLMASAGFEGALWNVAINLGSIKDEAFRQETTAAVERMRERAGGGAAGLSQPDSGSGGSVHEAAVGSVATSGGGRDLAL